MSKQNIRAKQVAQGFLLLATLLLSLTTTAQATSTTYADHPEARKFIERMVTEHGFDRQYVTGLMAQAERKQSILDAIARPAEKTKTWAEYRRIFMTDTRISQGREFMQANADTLARAEREFGVPAAIITAIIGVETSYGRNKGSYRVLDALATLGFDYPPRGKFFNKQLEEYLILVKEQQFDAGEVKGSYAGAMGFGQFIPSSYRHYAIDFDGDGIADIVNNPIDAIGSVANYFKAHGWRPGQPVVTTVRLADKHDPAVADNKLKLQRTVAEAKQAGYQPDMNVAADEKVMVMHLQGEAGDEYWMGLKNFYVITRYNHSHLYAMAVYQLSQALAAN